MAVSGLIRKNTTKNSMQNKNIFDFFIRSDPQVVHKTENFKLIFDGNNTSLYYFWLSNNYDKHGKLVKCKVDHILKYFKYI